MIARRGPGEGERLNHVRLYPPASTLSRLVLLVLILSAIATPWAKAQRDSRGRPISEHMLVNDANNNLRSRTTIHPQDSDTAEITRNGKGQITEVKVKGPDGKVERHITIERGPETTTVKDVSYNPDGTTAYSSTTTYEGDGLVRYGTKRHHESYSTPLDTMGRPTGPPVVVHSWDEEWRDGEWLPVTQSSLSPRIASGELKVAIAGTGKTSGHVADLRITNTTKSPASLTIPPMVLESVSGKTQHYAIPGGAEATIAAGKTKVVPVDGVCLVRNKPPVGRGVADDLLINEGGPEGVTGLKLPAKDVRSMLKIATSATRAAEQLEKNGALKEIPYSNPDKREEIVVQWSVWSNPELSSLTGVPPASREDLQKVVYKQMSGTMTPSKKKIVDEGIETIFEKVELTSERAKDLEGPAPLNIADETEAAPVAPEDPSASPSIP